MSSYQFAAMGSPTSAQLADLEACLKSSANAFGLELGREVTFELAPNGFEPNPLRAAAVAYFGGASPPLANVKELSRRGIAIIPVASSAGAVRQEIPSVIAHLNCLTYETGGADRLASALLECAGLLRRERRVFLSYRRSEAREAALQLFEAFSSRLFDVFLDTHDIAPGDDFQEMLWHRLCDSDVLVMLDTPTYFESRWTAQEFGRALAKGIAVLRIGWPDSTPSVRTLTASRVELLESDIDQASGRLLPGAVQQILNQVEAVRSQSQAVRTLNLISSVRFAVEQLGGHTNGVGLHKALSITLPDGQQLVCFPSIGVPSSEVLHAAAERADGKSVAVVFDPVGIRGRWLAHIDWLGGHIAMPRWLKSTEAAWQLAAW